MLIVTFLLAILIVGIGYYISHDIFSPYVAVPGIWAIAILIYYFLPNTFYPIKNNFPFILTVWIVGFVVASIACDYIAPPASKISKEIQPNQNILLVYSIITCISIPIVCAVIIKQAFMENPENIFRYMRMMSTGQDENIEMPKLGILLYFVSLSFVMIFFALLYFKSTTTESFIGNSNYGKNFLLGCNVLIVIPLFSTRKNQS